MERPNPLRNPLIHPIPSPFLPMFKIKFIFIKIIYFSLYTHCYKVCVNEIDRLYEQKCISELLKEQKLLINGS